MEPSTLADLGTGTILLVVGALAASRAPARPTGLLIAATGVAWLAGAGRAA